MGEYSRGIPNTLLSPVPTSQTITVGVTTIQTTLTPSLLPTIITTPIPTFTVAQVRTTITQSESGAYTSRMLGKWLLQKNRRLC